MEVWAGRGLDKWAGWHSWRGKRAGLYGPPDIRFMRTVQKCL